MFYLELIFLFFPDPQETKYSRSFFMCQRHRWHQWWSLLCTHILCTNVVRKYSAQCAYICFFKEQPLNFGAPLVSGVLQYLVGGVNVTAHPCLFVSLTPPINVHQCHWHRQPLFVKVTDTGRLVRGSNDTDLSWSTVSLKLPVSGQQCHWHHKPSIFVNLHGFNQFLGT
jgi:hypothetical protein